MNTVTEVQSRTEVQSSDSCLVLSLCEEVTVDSLVQRLTDIVEQHLWREDPLSLRLSWWGSEVCSLILEHDGIPESEFIDKVVVKIEELRRKVLVNAFDRATLKEVVVASGWVWEKWMLEHYKTLSRTCPFSGQELAEEEEHPFADQLIEWLGEATAFKREFFPERMEKCLSRDVIEKMPAESALAGYQRLAREAISIQELEEDLHRGKQTRKFLIQGIENAKAHRRAQTLSFNEFLKKCEEGKREEINWIRETQSRTLMKLKELCKEKDEIIHALDGRLSAAEDKIVEQDDKIRSLENRLYADEEQIRILGYKATHRAKGGMCAVM